MYNVHLNGYITYTELNDVKTSFSTLYDIEENSHLVLRVKQYISLYTTLYQCLFLGCRFINLQVSSLVDKWYGESQKRSEAVFSLVGTSRSLKCFESYQKGLIFT